MLFIQPGVQSNLAPLGTRPPPCALYHASERDRRDTLQSTACSMYRCVVGGLT